MPEITGEGPTPKPHEANGRVASCPHPGARANNGKRPVRARVAKPARPAPTLRSVAPLHKPKGRTDTNNAARLAARYGDEIRWVGPWDKWLVWDGTRWRVDRALAVELKAKEIAEDLFQDLRIALREN
jgi:hypothetical protein